jgi:hypothetical protein
MKRPTSSWSHLWTRYGGPRWHVVIALLAVVVVVTATLAIVRRNANDDDRDNTEIGLPDDGTGDGERSEGAVDSAGGSSDPGDVTSTSGDDPTDGIGPGHDDDGSGPAGGPGGGPGGGGPGRGPGQGDRGSDGTGGTGPGEGSGDSTSTTGGQPSTGGPPAAQFIEFDAWSQPIHGEFREPIGATASSGLPVSYELREGSSEFCHISGGSLVVDPWQRMHEGDIGYVAWFPAPCIVEATQAGGNGYAAARPVVRTLQIDMASVLLDVTEERTADGFVVTVSDPARLATQVKADFQTTLCQIPELEPGEITLPVRMGPGNNFSQSFHVVPKDGGWRCVISFESWGELEFYAFRSRGSEWTGIF